MSYDTFAKYYDLLTDDISYEQRADYFHKLLKSCKLPGSILLDLACGTGNLSFALSSFGYEVIGVDASPEMLSIAMQKQEVHPENKVLFLCQKMEELDLYGTIDVAVCALDSLNHITDKQILQSVLDKVSLFLHPQGFFIFDVNTVYKHREILGNQTFVFDREDVYCVWQNSFALESNQDNIVEINLDFFEYDEEHDSYYRSSESFCERAYTHKELCEMLENSGMEIVSCFGADTMDPPADNAQRLVYIVKKKA